MFGKKNEKLEILKDLVGSREGYIDTVKMLELNKEEKDIFLLTSIEVKKKKPNLNIVDEAYEILVNKSGGDKEDSEENDYTQDTVNTSIQDDNKILDFINETIGESSKFMAYINKYNFSQNERAILSGTFSDLKKEPYDMGRICSAYEIIRAYEQEYNSMVKDGYEPMITQNDEQDSSKEESQKKSLAHHTVNDSSSESKMKKRFILPSVSKIIIAIASAALVLLLLYVWIPSGEVVDANSLVKRNGMQYLINEDKPFTGTVEKYYKINKYSKTSKKADKSRAFKAIIEYKNGKKDGLLIEWYRNGQKSFESYYEDGISVGIYTMWHNNGQKKSVGNVHVSAYSGQNTEWYYNGQKKSKEEYDNGKKIGKQLEWYRNGQVCQESLYDNDKEKGYKWYYRSGELKAIGEYKKGKLVSESRYYKNGKINEKDIWKNGHHLKETKWLENGELVVDGTYKNGNHYDGTFFTKEKLMFMGSFSGWDYYIETYKKGDFIGKKRITSKDKEYLKKIRFIYKITPCSLEKNSSD